MNEWRFVVGYRIIKNSIGFYYVIFVEIVYSLGYRGFLKDLNVFSFY